MTQPESYLLEERAWTRGRNIIAVLAGIFLILVVLVEMMG